jgi:hypothetical protein
MRIHANLSISGVLTNCGNIVTFIHAFFTTIWQICRGFGGLNASYKYRTGGNDSPDLGADEQHASDACDADTVIFFTLLAIILQQIFIRFVVYKRIDIIATANERDV